MKAVIISYTLEKLNPKQRIAIHRSLYNHTDYSNKGSYQYERKGLIDSFPSLKLNRGVLIIPKKNKKEIITMLKKNNASVISISIEINDTILN